MSGEGAPSGPAAGSPPPADYRACLDFLYARNQFAMKLGLDNIRALLERLGRPQDGLALLHVAGTNGKGSVCANLAAMLRAAGYPRVGLYTSPHLVSFRERIQVDGEPVPRDFIVSFLGRALPDIEALGATYFEIVTAMALCWFRERGCGAVVLETGLGGRLDATNAVVPAVTVITSVSLDHVQILGPTVEAIWREKIAILKPGVPMVVREDRPHLLAELGELARQAGSPVHSLKDHPWEAEGDAVRYRGRFAEYRLPADLREEEHQRENLALSLLALETFLGGPVPADALEPALRGAKVPGRTQLLEAPGRRPVLLDGAHNPGGMEALARYVTSKFPGRRVEALFAVMRDKDAVPVYRGVRRFARTVRFVPLGDRYPRALACAELRALLDGAAAGSADAEGARDPGGAGDAAAADLAALREFPGDGEEAARALEALLREGGDGPDLVVVCGSLYLLGSLIPKLVPMYPGLAWFRQFEGEN